MACVAGVRKGRGRELGREGGGEGLGVPFLSPSHAQIPPSPFNACHAVGFFNHSQSAHDTKEERLSSLCPVSVSPSSNTKKSLEDTPQTVEFGK